MQRLLSHCMANSKHVFSENDCHLILAMKVVRVCNSLSFYPVYSASVIVLQGTSFLFCCSKAVHYTAMTCYIKCFVYSLSDSGFM